MASEPTLGDLIETVGVLDVLVAPNGMDVVVGEAVIHDPEEGWVGRQHDVILAVGVDPARAGAAALVDKAGGVGAAALVIKMRGDRSLIESFLAAAREARVAVLAAPADMAWGQLHALARTAAATGGGDDQGIAPIGDLFALANAVAATVGGPVTIEDPRSTVLAYSNVADHEVDEGRRATILGHRVPEEWIQRQQDDGVFRRLFREHGVVRTDYTEFGLKPRIAIAIRAGDEILGSIWVQEGDRPLDDEAETALTEGARMAALHLLRHRSGADLERGRRAELLRAALEGRVEPDALLPVLQLSPGVPLTVIAVHLTAGASGDDAALAVQADRAASMITLYCESYRRQAAVVALGAVVYVLVPSADDSDRSRLPALAAGMCERVADALKVEARAGVGRTVAGIHELLASRREADRVLRALAASPHVGPAATADAVRSRLVLQYLQEEAAGEATLRGGKLDQLVEHDARRGTEYIATLRAFFDALGDMPAAAAGQGVHPNTFRYRMRRLAEVASLDLDDPVERLVLQLQLHFLDS
jgi:PucR-like helix-turn-helix protein/diguanylate cyclase with GGDEF domain